MSGMAAPRPPGTAVDRLMARGRLRPLEALPWVAAVAAYFLFPDYLLLGISILIMTVFALSVDLVMGYAGLVTLGHAAYFGVGAYTAGLLAKHGWPDPLLGLAAAAAMGALVGLLAGAVILRARGLTLLMLTLAVVSMLGEAANKATALTGGADGLNGLEVGPLLGLFPFDFYGRTGYLYCLAVLFMVWGAVRTLVNAPFGRALVGIRENDRRMRAVGTPVRRRLVQAYAISGAIAAMAGALLAQTTQSVALRVLSFELSGDAVIMLMIGGFGRLYGAFVGAPLYLIAQDTIAKEDPVYWFFWIGLILVLLVLFAREGVLGLVDRLAAGVARRLRGPR